jgi:hypothetical protein
MLETVRLLEVESDKLRRFRAAGCGECFRSILTELIILRFHSDDSIQQGIPLIQHSIIMWTDCKGLPVFDKLIPVFTLRLNKRRPAIALWNAFPFRISNHILAACTEVYQCSTQLTDKCTSFILRPVQFVGAFVALRKATITFVMSVRLHVTTRLPLDEFSWDLIFVDFSKICWKKFNFH